MKQNSIGMMFLSLAEKYGDRVAIRTSEGAYTYRGLKKAVVTCALNLRDNGVEQNSLICMDMKPVGNNETIAPLATILALSLLGSRWIMFEDGILENETLRVSKVLTNRLDADLPAVYLKVDADFFSEVPPNYQGVSQVAFEGYADEDGIFFLASSSGTTGDPKKMAIGSTMMFERAVSLTEYDNLNAPLVLSALFVKITNIAVLHMLAVLLRGGTYVLNKDYKVMAEIGVNYTVGSPAQLRSLLANVPVPEKPLIFQAKVMGAALAPSLLKTLLQYFQTVRVSYGSTEAGPVTTRLISEYSEDTSVGKVADDVDVEIIGDNGEILAPDATGQVRINTHRQVGGYQNAPDATADAFKNGWFYPGDIGYLTADRHLYIKGRVKDQINVGGVKVNAARIDELILSTEGVVNGMCFTEQDDEGFPVLAAALSVSEGQDMETLINAMFYEFRQKGIATSLFPRNIYPVKGLPQNLNGKTVRSQLASAVNGIKPIVITIDNGPLH